MGLEQRPYVGTWRLNQKKVRQYTPDCLVYINGDLSIPGSLHERRRIDIQKYIVSVTVDAGTDPGGASSQISLSIPMHSNDALVQDSQFILRPGLEVHVYMRGYFPVRGLFRYVSDYVDKESGIYDKAAQEAEEASKAGEAEETLSGEAAQPLPVVFNVGTQQSFAEGLAKRDGKVSSHLKMILEHTEYDAYIAAASEKTGVPFQIIKGMMALESHFGHCPPNRVGATGLSQLKLGTAQDRAKEMGYKKEDITYDVLLYNNEVNIQLGAAHLKWLSNLDGLRTDGEVDWYKVLSAYNQGHKPVIKAYERRNGANTMSVNACEYGASILSDIASLEDGSADDLIRDVYKDLPQAETRPPVVHHKRPSDDLISYPYYHVFHGVVTQADHAYSGGFLTASLNCGSMLYFWTYHAMSTSASQFGARPIGSKLQTTMIGNNFNGWHPYEIIYKLCRDVGGAAQGVSWALSQKTNTAAKIGSESLFSLNLAYWQQRFNTTMMKLRLFGATGQVFNAAQAAFLGRLSSSSVNALYERTLPKRQAATTNYQLFSTAALLGLLNPKKKKALQFAAATGEGSKAGVNLYEMVAFVQDLSQMGSVNFFESTYETKMDIAQKVCEVTGFEFYQDVDGDLVFKPPMYNLDTSTSRIYRIEDIDIISLNFSEKEPEVTYMTVKGSHWQSLTVSGFENEWGVQGQYIDYRLVAQFGWRGQSFETAYFNSRTAMFYAAVSRMDVVNAGSRYASLTIPLRPELRPGYPVYIPYLDCYYYCNSFSHSFQFGGQCTTSMQLIAKRAKFFAPGVTGEGAQGISAIKLDKPHLPRRPLMVIDNANMDGIRKKRLMGFPNVVMALDPNKVNPLYSIVGQDILNIENPDSLKGLLELAADKDNVITRALGVDNEFLGYYTYRKDEKTSIVIQVDDAKVAEGSTIVNIQKTANEYVKIQDVALKTLDDAKTRAEAAKNVRQDAEQEYIAAKNSDNKEKKAQAPAISAKVAALEKEEIQALGDLLALQELNFDENNMLKTKLISDLSMEILKIVMTEAGLKLKAENPEFDDIDQSIRLLDLLGDKKAVFSTKSTPGTYRYYSSSHPDQEHQGNQMLPTTVDGWGFQEDVWATEGLTPEAVYAGMKVKRGLLVQLGGERKVVPTSDIRSISFACIDKTLQPMSKLTKVDGKDKPIVVVGPIKETVLYEFNLAATKAKPEDTLNGVFAEVWTLEQTKIEDEQTPKVSVSPGNYPDQIFECPAALPIGEILADPGRKKKWKNPQNLTQKAAAALAETFASNVSSSYNAQVDFALEQATLFSEDPNNKAAKFKELMKPAETSLEKYLSEGYQTGGVDTKKVSTKKMVESPVFPVSDSLGYEVVGSYAYGRDAGIADDGVLNQALNADPLSAIDQGTLERFVDALRQWQGHEQGDTGTEAYTSYQNAKANLVTELNKTYSPQELLNVGILRDDANGNYKYHLENFFADQRDSVNKLPVANAAYSLADLNFHLGRDDISDIKPMEAGILMEAMSTDFATVLESQDLGVAETYAEIDGIEDMSEPERIQALAIAKKRADWEDFQRNIRGKASEVPQRSTLAAINEAGRRIQGSADFIENQANAVATAAENIDEV